MVYNPQLPLVAHPSDDQAGIVDILPVGNDYHLAFFVIGRYQGIRTPYQSPVIPERVFIGLVAQCGAALDAHVAEPALFIFLLEGDVQHLFLVAVLEARGAGFLRFPVDDADLVHHGSRQVVQGRGLVVKEECPPAHGDLVDLPAVEPDFSVLGDFHAGHPEQQVLQHGIGPYPEGGRIEFDRILLDYDGIAHVGDGGRLQELPVHLQPDRAHVHLLFTEIPLCHIGLIPHHLDMERITAERDFVQLCLALGVRQREIGDGRILGGDHIYRCERNRLIRERVHDRSLDLAHPLLIRIVINNKYLCTGRQSKAQDGYRNEKDFLHTILTTKQIYHE